MTFTQAVEIIRERAGDDIEYIVGEYIDLKRSGNGMKALCPFHDEKTESFRVSGQKKIYKCFGCGEGGDAIDFVMKMDGKEFHEAIYKLADRYLITIDSNDKDAYREKIQTNEQILPGITDLKSEIRKKETVFIAMNETGAGKDVDGPKIIINGRISDAQARTLKKFTEQCVLLVRDMPWHILKDTIKTLLKHGFMVEIANPEFIHIKKDDWLTYTLPEMGGLVTRKEIIELLAAIPDDLTRSVYTAEFSTYLNNHS
jgi:hypothetical protein